MALSAFDDKARTPRPAELKKVLGTSSRWWEELIDRIAADHAPIEAQWNFAGAKYGWSLRLKRKDRAVIYLTPQAGQFLVGIVLGEKAVQRAREAGLPAAILTAIDQAPRYVEGRGIRLPVKTRAGLAAIVKLAAAKMAT